MAMRTPDQLTDLFRAHGLRVTPQRQSVFRALHGNQAHPTAEAVHALVVEEMPTVSLRTVYATLHDLAAMGEIGELELGTGSARFDPNTTLHHHLVCDRCGRVHDVEATFASVRLPDDLEDGFEVSGTEIVLRGTCGPCRTAKDVQHTGLRPDPADRPSPIGSRPSSGDEPHG